MKPVKSVSFSVFQRLFVLFVSWPLVSCGGGSFSSTAPGASKRDKLAALDASASVHTTDAKVGYVFSKNFINYNPPISVGGSAKVFNSPVYSYSIGTVSGMPSLIGIETDSPPLNTKFIKVSPSDRHLYVLTGDNLIYTFSIGFSIFSEDEFKNHSLNPLGLYNALTNAGYITGAALSAEDIVNKLNALLEQPDLYDQIHADNPDLTETVEIIKLKADTIYSRNKLYSDLTESEQKSIIRLNRLMIELVYPLETPTNKGARVQHAIGTPVLPPDSWNSSQSIELDTFGKFAYALGSKIVGYDPITGAPIINPAVAVYARDQATGALSFIDVQLLDIGRLIFAQSGLYAYGSTNGSLQTYSVNRSTGLLTGLGAPFAFRRWLVGDPYYNMALSPTGKFLYLLANSGIQQHNDPYLGCVDTAQLGSLIHTFIVDQNTGLLTQDGSPIDTTPHVITSASVDTKGRFVQLLNTYEYVGGSYTPDACDAGSDSLLNAGAIYSYYVEQASGKLIPTGSVQAGGAQLPTGFVAAGLDSISLTGDVSGRFLYLLNPNDMYVYNVDQANGALTAIGSPLTGATATPMPGTYAPTAWPSVCYTNSTLNGYCTKLTGSRSHSLTLAGY
jgi:hypothetical protein